MQDFDWLSSMVRSWTGSSPTQMPRSDWLLVDFFGKILDKVEFQIEIYFKN